MIGFLVILILVAASVLLFVSMTRHLRKVPKSFEPPPAKRGPDDPPIP